MSRTLGLDPSALSPREWEEYLPLLHHLQQAPPTTNASPTDLFSLLKPWLDNTVDARTEKDIIALFRVPAPTTPPLHTLLALLRLYSHSLNSPYLTRDLCFIQSNEPAKLHPPPPPRRQSLAPTTTINTSQPARSPPLRSPVEPGRSVGRLGSLATAGLPPTTADVAPSPTGTYRSVSSSTGSSRGPPPPPPAKRLSISPNLPPPSVSPHPEQTTEVLRNPLPSTNPFRARVNSSNAPVPIDPSTTFASSPPASTASTSSPPSQWTIDSRETAASSLPPLPPRPKEKPSDLSSTLNKPPPRRSSKPPALPTRRASLPANGSYGPSSSSSATPRLSIISSSPSSSRTTPSTSQSSTPVVPPSKLVASTHIGLTSRLQPSFTGSGSNAGVDEDTHSHATSTPSTSHGIKGRMSRSNSSVSSGSGAVASSSTTTGHAGYVYERTSPGKKGSVGGSMGPPPPPSRTASTSTSRSSNWATAPPTADEDNMSIATAPLPSTSTFPLFYSSTDGPPGTTPRSASTSTFASGGQVSPSDSLGRSKTVGSKPFPPPPPKRIPLPHSASSSTLENPFEPSSSTRGPPPPSLHRTSSLSHNRRISASPSTTKDFGSDLSLFLEKGGRQSEEWMNRAKDEVVRRTSGRRGGREERERLVDREEEDEDEEVETVGEELDVEVERDVRRGGAAGARQWAQLD